MKLNVFILLCYCSYQNVASDAKSVAEANETSVRHKRLSYFEIIGEDLLDNNWDDYEKPCLNRLVDIIRNVQNSTLWATWIWDSMQNPVGQLYGTKTHLGNYDQCLDLPWKEYPEFRTQYCLAEINLCEAEPDVRSVNLIGPIQDFVQSKTKHNLKYNSLTWGVCTPAICKPESIAKFVKVLFKNTHLAHLEPESKISVNPEFCKVSGEPEKRTFGDSLVLSLIAFSTVLTLLCTWYVNLKGIKLQCTGQRFIKAFDIKANAEALFDNSEDCIGSVPGVRMMSVLFITFGHFSFFKTVFGVSTAGKHNKMLDTTIYPVFYNLETIVDSFLMISGLLWMYNLMQKRVKTFNPLKVIAKRYVRFMWPIAVILSILPQALTPTEPGPLARMMFKVEREACTNNWWKIILTIANYTDKDEICYPILWSVLCDLHACVVGTLIYWIYVKNRRAGLQAFAIGATASVILPIIHAYKHNSAPVIKLDFLASDTFRAFFISDPTYSWSHNRFGPFFVGMAVGYLLSVLKPAKHKNVLSKKLSILAFLIFLVMFTSLIYACYSYNLREGGAMENAIFSVLRRVIWAALIGFLIIICEYGTLPLVTSFFRWSVWVPLSKLSYGIYLTHFVLILRMMSENRTPPKQDVFEDIVITFGLMVVLSMVSLFIWLFLETPVINLIFNTGKSSENLHRNGKVETGLPQAEAVDTENNEILQNKVDEKMQIYQKSKYL